MRVIKSENGGQPYWIAPRNGDPGRTLVLENARVFDTYSKAQKYTNIIIKNNSHRPHLKDNLKIVKITPSN